MRESRTISTVTWVSNLPKRPKYFPSIIGIISLFFILLIIFLISNSIISWPGVTVNLPQMDAVEISAADKLIVTITQEDEIFFNGEKRTWKELEQILSKKVHDSGLIYDKLGSKAATATRVPTIVVCADKNVKLESWSRIVDIARGLNMEVVLVADPHHSDSSIYRLPPTP